MIVAAVSVSVNFTAYAQFYQSPYQDMIGWNAGDAYMRRSIRTMGTRDGQNWDIRSGHDVRSSMFKKLGYSAYEPWHALRGRDGALGSGDGELDPEGMSDDEEIPRVDPTSDVKQISHPMFQPLRGMREIMDNNFYPPIFTAGIAGPLSLWNIAMAQTEPAIAAGAHNSLVQAQNATRNVMDGVQLLHKTLPGNERERRLQLRQYFGCVTGSGTGGNAGRDGTLEDFSDCMNDWGGPNPNEYTYLDSPDRDPGFVAAITPHEILLSDILFSHVITNSFGTDAHGEYMDLRDDFIKWFGDIQWEQTPITPPSASGTRTLSMTRVDRGADIKRVVREIARDRYYLVVALAYIGCVGRNLNNTDVHSVLGVTSAEIYPMQFLQTVTTETARILDPNQRGNAWLLNTAAGGGFQDGMWVPATGSADISDIWSQYVDPELMRKLSVPEVPLQGATIEAWVEIYDRTRRKDLNGAVIDPLTVCDDLHPDNGLARISNQTSGTTEIDIFAVYYRYAKFLATIQVTRAFHEALIVIQDLKNIEDYYKQLAYDMIYEKLGHSSIAEVLTTNVRRFQDFIFKLHREDIGPTSGRKGGALLASARERLSIGQQRAETGTM